LRGATARLAELAQSATSHRADRAAFIESWRRDVLENLAARRTDLAETEAAISKAAHVQDLISVTAPQDGVVLETTSRAPGSILGEAEPLATLLPAHAGLQAELTIKSADIGYIRTGDTVSLKIDAYPFQRHGMLSGRVRAIAAASFDQGAQDPTPVHRVAIDLTSATLTDLPQGTGPTPGMTLSGDVNIGTRSVLAYFLTPITGGLRQSLREP
jgi:HlyD family secretion protein